MKYAACEKCAKSVGTINIFGNILMILLKAYLGVVGRSKGMIADAIHSCADLLATIVMIIGMRISGKKANEEYPYGYGKAEYVVAVIIYIFLFVIAIYLIYDGIRAILEGREIVPCFSAFWGGIFSIAINELMFRQTLCVGTQINSPSMIAKAWESRSDVYSSIAVVIGILGAKLGFHWMDPLAAVAVGLIILKICVEYIKDSLLNLMDRAPDEELLEQVSKSLARVKNIRGVRKIYAREVGNMPEFEIELDVPEDMTVAQGEGVKREAERVVIRQMENGAKVLVRLCTVTGGSYENS
jgi:cation diffusion facilitator family transporter